MDDSSFLNFKILNLILSKILKLNVEAFQNYFYKVKVSKLSENSCIYSLFASTCIADIIKLGF
jgi:hypothetical protein